MEAEACTSLEVEVEGYSELEAAAEACTSLEEVVEAHSQLAVVEVCLEQEAHLSLGVVGARPPLEAHSQLGVAAEPDRLGVMVEEAGQLRSVFAQACLPLEEVCMSLAVAVEALQ